MSITGCTQVDNEVLDALIETSDDEAGPEDAGKPHEDAGGAAGKRI